jgi:hypothetical protein
MTESSFQLGTDMLLTQFAGFATDYFRNPQHPLDRSNRGTLFLPMEARLSPADEPITIVVAALNGPDLRVSQSGVRFQAFADLGMEGRLATATPYGRGEQDHMQAFNTLEQLLGNVISPDRLEIRPTAFPSAFIKTAVAPVRVPAPDIRYPIYGLRSTDISLKL